MRLADGMRNFAPRPRVRALDWFRENISTMDGRPYDHGAYPHIGAPGGPCDALDDPNILTIWMQWASRLGKTFFGQAATLFYADLTPCPMMFASESEKLAVEVVQRTYKMLERCPPLRRQLRPVVRRRQHQIDLDNCRVFVGWARSVSTLADKAVRLGHANEIDKWEHQSTSKEADPLKLFQDRGKEFPSRKFIFESTPTVKGRSRVERGRLSSTNCQYFVPCPHCKTYQRLRKDATDGKGGIVWEHLPGGKSDKELARRTARYVCEHCGETIKDEHRAWMMRRGVWAPEGCGVDSGKALALFGAPPPWRGWEGASWITGTPSRNGRDAGYQLSSLNALSLGWGDIAAEFVDVAHKPQDNRNFINQWLAETWEISARKTTWQQLGERVIDRDVPRGVVPSWASAVTIGIDKQTDRFVYVVEAWGPGRQNHTVAYGELETLAEVRSAVIERRYKHADGGDVGFAFALIDSGFQPEGVYEFCKECKMRQLNPVWPCKGSNKDLAADYVISFLKQDSLNKGLPLFHIDTFRTQGWIDRVLHVVDKGEEGAFSLYGASLYEHQDFLEQLLNDAAVNDLDTNNNNRESWERMDVGIPNDYRDCKRYAYAALLIATRGKDVPARAKPKPKKTEVDDLPPAKGVKFLERPGGWLNVR